MKIMNTANTYHHSSQYCCVLGAHTRHHLDQTLSKKSEVINRRVPLSSPSVHMLEGWEPSSLTSNEPIIDPRDPNSPPHTPEAAEDRHPSPSAVLPRPPHASPCMRPSALHPGRVITALGQVGSVRSGRDLAGRRGVVGGVRTWVWSIFEMLVLCAGWWEGAQARWAKQIRASGTHGIIPNRRSQVVGQVGWEELQEKGRRSMRKVRRMQLSVSKPCFSAPSIWLSSVPMRNVDLRVMRARAGHGCRCHTQQQLDVEQTR